MESGQIRNLRTGKVVAKQIWIANSFWTRFRGLLGRSNLAPSEGLWLKPCQQVHMLGMKFPLSVWFLDRKGQVCGLIDDLRPWKVSPRFSEAISVLEFPVGWGKATNTLLGDQLTWEDSITE